MFYLIWVLTLVVACTLAVLVGLWIDAKNPIE